MTAESSVPIVAVPGCNTLSVLQGVAVHTATCVQLHKRAEKITSALLERGGLNTGDNVVLLYPPGQPCTHTLTHTHSHASERASEQYNPGWVHGAVRPSFLSPPGGLLP